MGYGPRTRGRSGAWMLIPLAAAWAAAAHAEEVEWFRFSPAVVTQGVTETVELTCLPLPPFTRLTLSDPVSAEETPLSPRGDGSYGISFDPGDLALSLGEEDAFRKFAGFLRVYDGAVETVKYSTFIDVVTAEIPPVSLTLQAADLQATPHLLNVVAPLDASLEEITGIFYRHYGDDYDLINIVYETGRFENAGHRVLGNDVLNIGMNVDSDAALYGSAGRLKGITRFPIPTFFDGASPHLLHEFGHQWVQFLPVAPVNSTVPHWPLSTLAREIMGWGTGRNTQGLSFDFTPVPQRNGTWVLRHDPEPKEYSGISLYLMGLLPHTETGTETVFLNQSQPVSEGAVWRGPVATISGSDIVAALGPRVPDWRQSRKDFRMATILVSQDGLASREMIRLYDWFAARASLTEEVWYRSGFVRGVAKPFHLATRGLGTLDSTLWLRINPIPPRGFSTPIPRIPFLPFSRAIPRATERVYQVPYYWPLKGPLPGPDPDPLSFCFPPFRDAVVLERYTAFE